jgi:hypothetical protein
MTQKDKIIFQYKESIADTLEKIVDRLNSYEMLDATLSENTLMRTNAYLMAADRTLESGFVKDACKEIEDYFKCN